MHRISGILLFGVVGFAACTANPAEVVDDGSAFPVVAHWTATSAPIGSATVTGALTFDQHLGYHSDVTFSVTGPPNKAFQWRIFKQDCSVNVQANNNNSPTGLIVFATTQSYPDITLDATGKATVTTVIAGWLDSLTAYSVRIRPTATTTFNGVDPAACGNLQYAPAN